MYKQISIYIVLLLALVALTFFLTTYYIDSQTNQSKNNQNLNIFQAEDINLKLNFFGSDFDITLKSKMINGLSDSKILTIYNFPNQKRPDFFTIASYCNIIKKSKNKNYSF